MKSFMELKNRNAHMPSVEITSMIENPNLRSKTIIDKAIFCFQAMQH